MDFVDIDSVREGFAIRASLIQMELEAMLEKTRAIEGIILKEIRSSVSDVDFYKPGVESKAMEPARKRMKH